MEDILPCEFNLCQNSPNPFREWTTIKYCLPVKSRVILTLYNPNNKKLRKLVSKTQQAGTYEIKLNGKDLLEDHYYYQIIALKPPLGLRILYSKMKRMAILKRE